IQEFHHISIDKFFINFIDNKKEFPDLPLNISAESGKAMSLSLIRDHDVSEEELENNLLEGNDEPFDKDLSLDRTIQNISINLGDLLVTAKSSNLSESPEDSGFSGKLEATTPTALDRISTP
ncbi:hypothetical protein Bhyg_17232, partial [Pseudolycoriella hygida]